MYPIRSELSSERGIGSRLVCQKGVRSGLLLRNHVRPDEADQRMEECGEGYARSGSWKRPESKTLAVTALISRS